MEEKKRIHWTEANECGLLVKDTLGRKAHRTEQEKSAMIKMQAFVVGAREKGRWISRGRSWCGWELAANLHLQVENRKDRDEIVPKGKLSWQFVENKKEGRGSAGEEESAMIWRGRSKS